MQITGIGIDAKTGPIIEDIAAELVYFQECEFDIVELSVHDVDVMFNGRLHPARLDAIAALVRQFDFSYTVHAPDRLNLAFGSDPDLEKDVFAASLEFCAATGSRLMVYHSGLSAFAWMRLPGSQWPDQEQMRRGQEAEAKALQTLLPMAARHGITVAMENMNLTGYETARLHQAGLPASALRDYFPSLFPSELIEQLRRVDHPNLGLTFDFGHLYTAARACGIDYLETIKEAAPYIRHLHVSDNFGRPEGPFSGPREKNTHGEGDLHLPPGWGDIPFESALALLSDYSGAMVLELRDRYRPYYREAKSTLQTYLHLNA
jgi:sugar phosphate isomerase/epimerase